MGDLYNRLKERKELPAHRSSEKKEPRGSRSPRRGVEDLEPPTGFEREGPLFVRRERMPRESISREFTTRQALLEPDHPVSLPRRLSGRPAAGTEEGGRGGRRPAKTYLFYDLEATGLSTGAGTVAFLLGFARVSEDGFEVIQWLLPDYPYEPELLTAVIEHLQAVEREVGEVTLVSYNGRTFDTPLLKSRMLMNGIAFEPPPELDLLPVTRRLWRRELESCSLGTVEEEVLGIRREVDIAGALVPLRYFDYLERREPALLRELLAHHRQDIISLYQLFSRLERIILGEEAVEPRTQLYEATGYSRFELAKLLIETAPVSDARTRGEAILRELVGEGGEESASLYFGWYLRRRGSAEEALEVWLTAFRSSGSAACGIMGAKLLEHRFRRYSAALEVVDTLLEALTADPTGPEAEASAGGPAAARTKPSSRLVAALRHRQARLRRRIASS